uniref:Uncharacterized protein n=1 Tax=Branchiostoma floridae TaxID=7739 RepID=C3ZKI4_BRAFL|eukprot:XP_002591072.1 hypothetical protein BRAFLDRAFT_69373 [Branchiostoma floridae]
MDENNLALIMTPNLMPTLEKTCADIGPDKLLKMQTEIVKFLIQNSHSIGAVPDSVLYMLLCNRLFAWCPTLLAFVHSWWSLLYSVGGVATIGSGPKLTRLDTRLKDNSRAVPDSVLERAAQLSGKDMEGLVSGDELDKSVDSLLDGSKTKRKKRRSGSIQGARVARLVVSPPGDPQVAASSGGPSRRDSAEKSPLVQSTSLNLENVGSRLANHPPDTGLSTIDFGASPKLNEKVRGSFFKMHARAGPSKSLPVPSTERPTSPLLNFSRRSNAMDPNSSTLTTNKIVQKMAAALSGPTSAQMSLLSCPLCSFTSTHQGALESHMVSHVRSKPEQFTCRICGYNTVSRSGLMEHVEKHNSRRVGRKVTSKPSCLLCEFIASDRLELEFHMFTHMEKLGDLLLCRDGDGLMDVTDEQVVVQAGGRLAMGGESEEPVAVQARGRPATSGESKTGKKTAQEKPLWCGECGFTARSRRELQGHLKTHYKRPTSGGLKPHAGGEAKKGGRRSRNARPLEKKFLCKECGYVAKYENELRNHLKTHYEKALLCEECGFKTWVEVEMRAHTGERPLECAKCCFRISCKVAMREHRKTHETTLVCWQCGYKAKYDNELRNHLRTHNEKALVCEECGFKTWVETEMRAHTGDRPLKCDKCSYTVSCKVVMSKHRRTHVEKKTPLVCKKCGYQTIRKHNFLAHLRLHTGEKPFSCGQCDYKTAFKTSLTLHFKTNKSKEPLSCEDCSFSTTCKRAMRTHLKDHTYACKTCDAVLNSKEELQKHVRNHQKEESEKALRCKVCDYKAFSRPCLEIHMRKHTGEKPFACQECSYRAKAKSTLKIHIANKHKKTFRCLECGFGTDEEDSMDEHVKVHVKHFTCGDCEFVATAQEDIDAHMSTHASGTEAIMCGKCRRYWTTIPSKIGVHMQTCCADKL